MNVFYLSFFQTRSLKIVGFEVCWLCCQYQLHFVIVLCTFIRLWGCSISKCGHCVCVCVHGWLFFLLSVFECEWRRCLGKISFTIWFIVIVCFSNPICLGSSFFFCFRAHDTIAGVDELDVCYVFFSISFQEHFVRDFAFFFPFLVWIGKKQNLMKIKHTNF